MSKKITQPHNKENRKINTHTVGWFQWVVSKAKDILSMRVSDILVRDKGDNTKRFFSILLSSKLPKSSSQSADVFMRKITDAKHEWSFYAQDFKNRECLRDIYEWENVFFWTNGSNFWHYRFETTYQWRRLSVMFYNSADYDGKKVSFEEFVQKNEPMRVCFY